MKLVIGAIIALGWMVCGHAGETTSAVTALIPSELAEQWLAQDPTVLAARGELDAARAEAGQLAASPYEWTSSLSYQQRDYGRGPNSHEWNIGLERQIRLPTKRRADQEGAAASLALAQTQFNLARRQAAMDLLGGWLDWLTAHAVKTLLEQQQRFAEDNLAAVIKRVRSGDAAVLEQRLAAAEVSEFQRNAAAAAIDEAMAWAKLSARFVIGDRLTPMPLPEPVAMSRDVAWWRNLMLAVSDQLAAVNAQLALAEAGAERASADRIPDPTLGIYAANEAYGDENIVGGTISIPFPGPRRTLELQRRLAQVNAARDRINATTREIEGIARAAYAAAVGHYHRWKIAGTAATAMRENAVIAQKAYALGEQDLQTLLLARRQALNSAEAEQQARATALRAHYTLLIDTKLLWSGTPLDATPAKPEVAARKFDGEHD